MPNRRPLAKFAALLALALSALASCGAPDVQSLPERAETESTWDTMTADERDEAAANVDVRALLQRTDAVEICADASYDFGSASMGGEVFTQEIAWFGCQCVADTAQHMMDEVGVDNPEMQNIIIQFAINLDVRSAIVDDPIGLLAISYYGDDQMERDFGFSGEIFRAAMEQVGSAVARYEPETEELFAAAPSCLKVFSVTKDAYPDWASDLSALDYLDVQNRQKMIFDTGIDIDELDQILETGTPNASCEWAIGNKAVSTAYLTVAKEEGFASALAERTINIFKSPCARLNQKYAIPQTGSDWTPAQAEIMQKIETALWYHDLRKETSSARDLLSYIASRQTELGWTDANLDALESSAEETLMCGIREENHFDILATERADYKDHASKMDRLRAAGYNF